MSLFIVSIAPVFIILVYIYYRDKYEQEPIKLLIKGLLAGCIIVVPTVFIESFMQTLGSGFNGLNAAAWNAFMVAALVEETLKFGAVYFLIWRNPNFNEKFDGIVYAVFVSLGFAAVENILYVFGSDNGMNTGLMRAFTAVPAHAMFGIMMGYRLGLARFIPSRRGFFLAMGLLVPFLYHGIYDFILMSQKPGLVILFIPFVLFLLWRSVLRMRQLVESSFFNPENNKE
jgi:RsiW-degrading membrane proteinase PrsW (M82 family)